ncbi:hypothetical protein QNI16_27250 [Cytophagaceae bacterium YF14B1]|uniref:Uncharacterized protein n=1 Tax=Xanthocytophaga flava TaxID=3048013 RepID=A0AAE3QVV2_9BACT|nr:hypothetical protein [Xanthocytophaga flavus]MDJ1484225.1 hypothetical protein [Xanthocytophaga flavus]
MNTYFTVLLCFLGSYFIVKAQSYLIPNQNAVVADGGYMLTTFSNEKNIYLKLAFIHNEYLNKDSTLGFLITPSVSWSPSYNLNSFKYYTLLQSGLLSLTLQPYVINKVTEELIVRFYGLGALKILPKIDGISSPGRQISVGYGQWLLGGGIGFRFKKFDLSIQYNHVGHDIIDSSKVYFETYFDNNTAFFNSLDIQLNLGLNNKRHSLEECTLIFFVGWSGFLNSYTNQRLINLGIRVNLHSNNSEKKNK